MNKKIFTLLIILMSIAVIGIIVVQVFWINSSMEIRKKQFSSNVKSALIDISQNIKDREFRDYFKEFRPILSSVENLKKRELREIIYQSYDTVNNEIFTYKQSILEDNFESPITLFNSDSIHSTIRYKSFFLKKEKEISKLGLGIKKEIKTSKPILKSKSIGKMSALDKLQYEDLFSEIAPKRPIYKRVSITELQFKIPNELKERGIETPFEFAVFDGDLPTKVKSSQFQFNCDTKYKVPLFVSDSRIQENNYILYVSFPEQREYMMANIKRQLILASTFILFIILAFGSAIYQLMKQKRISEIKTDFINNMTHEFKTPIATINLALDAIRNPKIINDNQKVLKYVKMIRQENKRMHAQVENVLQISKLEKNQLDISKEVIDVHDLIEDAIAHVGLLVQNKGGHITTHFEALQTEVSASELHLTSVLVNVLDNAVKYTEQEPEIDVYTENAGNFILVKIKDNGIGMNKNVQKSIFDKFYREQKGNIHNVKGHGLGLSYVKKIVEYHHGTVYVESEKGIGSTFYIKLPVI